MDVTMYFGAWPNDQQVVFRHRALDIAVNRAINSCTLVEADLADDRHRARRRAAGR